MAIVVSSGCMVVVVVGWQRLWWCRDDCGGVCDKVGLRVLNRRIGKRKGIGDTTIYRPISGYRRSKIPLLNGLYLNP